MAAYADLIFAFGLARLQFPEDVHDLLGGDCRVLAPAGDVHSVLFEAYVYRIMQALRGEPLAGRLPVEMRKRMGGLEWGTLNSANMRYAVDRARASSRILEPDVRINPYRFVACRFDANADGRPDAGTIRATLSDAADAEDLKARLAQLRSVAVTASGAWREQDDLVRTALGEALWAGQAFAAEILSECLPVYDAARPSMEAHQRIDFLTAALSAALRYRRRDFFLPLAARACELARELDPVDFALFGDALERCARGYHVFHLGNELEGLLHEVTDRIRDGISRPTSGPENRCSLVRCLLAVAVGRYLLGHDAAARAIVEEARAFLFGLDLKGQAKVHLACTYAAAAARSPAKDEARSRLGELFDRLEGIEDTFTTMAYFSQSRIQFLEAVVLAVTESPAAGPDAVVPANANV